MKLKPAHLIAGLGALLLLTKKPARKKAPNVREQAKSLSRAATEASLHAKGGQGLAPKEQLKVIRKLLPGSPIPGTSATVGIVSQFDLQKNYPTPQQICVLHAIDPGLVIKDAQGSASVADLYALLALERPDIVQTMSKSSTQSIILDAIDIMPDAKTDQFCDTLIRMGAPLYANIDKEGYEKFAKSLLAGDFSQEAADERMKFTDKLRKIRKENKTGSSLISFAESAVRSRLPANRDLNEAMQLHSMKMVLSLSEMSDDAANAAFLKSLSEEDKNILTIRKSLDSMEDKLTYDALLKENALFDDVYGEQFNDILNRMDAAKASETSAMERRLLSSISDRVKP